MATKKGAGGEQQEYDTSTGQYGSGKTFRQNTPYHVISETLEREASIDLSDEQLPRSVGAKWTNYEIDMPDGSKAKFLEGGKIQNKEIIAGNGVSRKIDDIYRIVNENGGSREKWTKIKADADIEIYGKADRAEVHWYEEPSVGKVEFKFKKWI